MSIKEKYEKIPYRSEYTYNTLWNDYKYKSFHFKFQKFNDRFVMELNKLRLCFNTRLERCFVLKVTGERK